MKWAFRAVPNFFNEKSDRKRHTPLLKVNGEFSIVEFVKISWL